MKKTAVVTGASRGIGKAIAHRLAKDGYDLILICRSKKELLEKSATFYQQTYGTKSYCFAGNVGDEGFWRMLRSNLEEVLPFVEVVVNNAGISYVGLLNDMTPSQWQEIINVNLSALFYSAKVFSPEMIRQKRGHIINITSMWGQRGASCEVAYSASKGGVDAFTKALAKELAPSNVYVNAISCGVMDTDMMNVFSEEEKEDLADEIPFGRFGNPKEVATLISSLLSNTYITGQIIGLDGGYF